jgi:hypothetical protein
LFWPWPVFARNPPATESQRHALWFGFWSFIAAIAFLGFLSLIYDFHNCVYPSREHPYFLSGRLMLGALIPFVMLYVYGLDRALGCVKNRHWIRPLAAGRNHFVHAGFGNRHRLAGFFQPIQLVSHVKRAGAVAIRRSKPA